MQSAAQVFSTISLSQVLSFIILGFVSGFLVSAIDQRKVRGGMMATTLMGIAGAVIGGFLSNLFFGVGISGLDVSSLLIAVAGGLILAASQRLLSGTEEKVDTTPRYDYEQGRVAYYSEVTPLRSHTDSGRRSRYTPQTTSPEKLVNPIDLEKYLAGVDYPVSKADLLDHARRLNADANVLYTIEQLPDEEYNGPINVSEAIGKIE